MRYWISCNDKEEFSFEINPDWHVSVNTQQDGIKNTLEIYNVEKVEGEKIHKVVYYYKTEFLHRVSVAMWDGGGAIRVWDDSIVRTIKREMIKAGIEVRDDI